MRDTVVDVDDNYVQLINWLFYIRRIGFSSLVVQSDVVWASTVDGMYS